MKDASSSKFSRRGWHVLVILQHGKVIELVKFGGMMETKTFNITEDIVKKRNS